MKKKILSIILATAMFASYSVPTFAEENVSENEQTENIVTIEDADDVAKLVEELPEISDINDDIEEEGDGYVIEGESSDLTIIDSEVTVEDEFGEAISMNLPSEFNNIEGELAGEGTVVYNDDSLDASAAVQGIEEEIDGIAFEGFRGLITIENAEASHEYEFKFDLPEGTKLTKDGDYINIINENRMMYDENDNEIGPEVMGVIEPAWAKDANGDYVNTKYSINGNTLTQTVEFNDDSVFPIIADPTTKKPASKKVDSGTTTIKINLGELGGVSLFATTGQKVLTSAAKKKIMSKAAKKVASKFVPVLGEVSFAATVISYAAYKKGYKYLKMTVKFEKWTTYKSQGGKWIKGYIYKGCSLKCSAVKS